MKPKPDSVTIPRALARLLMRAAYWPCHGRDIREVMPEADEGQIEAMQVALDGWFSGIGMGLAPDFTSDRMLKSVVAAWERGSRPGGAM